MSWFFWLLLLHSAFSMMVKSWNIKPKNTVFLKTFIYLFMLCVLWERGVHAPWYFCDCQRTACRSPFSPSTMRVLRFEFKSLVLAASPCTCWALLQGPDAIFKWSDEWDAFLSERKKKCVSLGEYYHVTASSRLYLYSMNNLCYS